jgi:hypothetical protein
VFGGMLVGRRLVQHESPKGVRSGGCGRAAGVSIQPGHSTRRKG